MNSGHYGFPNILGLLRATAFRAVGKPGATAGAAFAGGTTSGAPTTGQFDAGDAVIDQSGTLWICTTAGSPGTFKQVSGSLPTTTEGDLIYYHSGANARLAVGATSGDALLSNATDPYWGDAAHDGPTRYEPLCDATGSVVVAGTGDPVMALVSNAS